jgi:uncharacterized protein YlxW (UPF0749 family)
MKRRIKDEGIEEEEEKERRECQKKEKREIEKIEKKSNEIDERSKKLVEDKAFIQVDALRVGSFEVEYEISVTMDPVEKRLSTDFNLKSQQYRVILPFDAIKVVYYFSLFFS